MRGTRKRVNRLLEGELTGVSNEIGGPEPTLSNSAVVGRTKNLLTYTVRIVVPNTVLETSGSLANALIFY